MKNKKVKGEIDKPDEVINANAENGSVSDEPVQSDASSAGIVPNVKNKSKRTKLILIISACVVFCAAMVPLAIFVTNKIRYVSAVSLLDSGEYEQAMDGFIALDDFGDSEDQAEYCRNMIDYLAAQDLVDDGDYEAARDIFLELEGFKRSEDKAEECQSMLDYIAAKELMGNEEFEAAKQAFLALGDFEDSETLAAECQNELTYREAVSLMDNGEYTSAATAFGQISGYKDSQDKAAYCQNKSIYNGAMDAYNNSLYYTAYLAFDSIYDFEDAASMTEACIIPFPETDETYHNDSYWYSLCDLTIETSADDAAYNYLKIYTADGTLVSCVAIRGGEKTKIRLPAGTYQIKTAYSYGDWFGSIEMFGDDGIYQVLSYGDSELIEFERNYIYTLTLRTETTDSEDAVDSRDVDRDDF